MTTPRYRKGSFKSARNANHPRLVVMVDCGHELLSYLDSPGGGVSSPWQWNVEVFRLLSQRILPWHGSLLTSIDLPQDDFKKIMSGLAKLKGIVSRVIIIGDPYLGPQGEHEIFIGPVGATVYILSSDFFEAVAGNSHSPWEVAFKLYAGVEVPKIEPEQFEWYFSTVGLGGPFSEVLLVRATDPVIRDTRGQPFNAIAYDTRK